MSRKNSKKSKTITTEKHHSTIPPKAKGAAMKSSAPVIENNTPIVQSAAAEATVQAVLTAADTTATGTMELTPTPLVADLSPLLAALHSLDADAACEAAIALGNSVNRDAVAPLIEILENTNGYFHSVVRSAAAAGLGTLKDSRAIDALLDAVHDPITDPSTEAIRALAAIGDVRAVGILIEVVRNESGFFAGSVRRAAVLGLPLLGGEAAQSTLREVAANENEDTVIRDEAIQGINRK